MIRLHTQLHYFAALLFRKDPDAVFNFLRHFGFVRILNRYLGIHTLGYWQHQMVYDSFRKRLICYYVTRLWGQRDLGCNRWVVQMAKPLNSDLALRAGDSMLYQTNRQAA